MSQKTLPSQSAERERGRRKGSGREVTLGSAGTATLTVDLLKASCKDKAENHTVPFPPGFLSFSNFGTSDKSCLAATIPPATNLPMSMFQVQLSCCLPNPGWNTSRPSCLGAPVHGFSQFQTSAWCCTLVCVYLALLTSPGCGLLRARPVFHYPCIPSSLPLQGSAECRFVE